LRLDVLLGAQRAPLAVLEEVARRLPVAVTAAVEAAVVRKNLGAEEVDERGSEVQVGRGNRSVHERQERRRAVEALGHVRIQLADPGGDCNASQLASLRRR